jgi:hypothetical protein
VHRVFGPNDLALQRQTRLTDDLSPKIRANRAEHNRAAHIGMSMRRDP